MTPGPLMGLEGPFSRSTFFIPPPPFLVTRKTRTKHVPPEENLFFFTSGQPPFHSWFCLTSRLPTVIPTRSRFVTDDHPGHPISFLPLRLFGVSFHPGDPPDSPRTVIHLSTRLFFAAPLQGQPLFLKKAAVAPFPGFALGVFLELCYPPPGFFLLMGSGWGLVGFFFTPQPF